MESQQSRRFNSYVSTTTHQLTCAERFLLDQASFLEIGGVAIFLEREACQQAVLRGQTSSGACMCLRFGLRKSASPYWNVDD